MSDFENSSLDDALSGAQAPEQPIEETTAQPAEPQEAPQEPVAEEAPTAEPAPQEPQQVPLAALQEVRNENREMKQMLAQLQQQQQPPAPQVPEFLDPEGSQFLAQQMQQMQLHMGAELSKTKAEMLHGADKVQAAYAAAQEAGMIDELGVKSDAWGELVKWHQREQVLSEVGDDPAAYRARVEADVRKQLEAEMVAKQVSAAAASPVPSMANVSGTGGGAAPNTWAGPTSLEAAIK